MKFVGQAKLIININNKHYVFTIKDSFTQTDKQAWCNNNGSFFTKHFHNEIMNISNELEFSQVCLLTCQINIY